MPREVPALSQSDRQEIEFTVTQWAEVHPRPDEPVMRLADGSQMTPRDMALAVHKPESRLGSYLYRVFAVGLLRDDVEIPETITQMLDDFRHDIELWKSGFRFHEIDVVEDEDLRDDEPSTHDEGKELGE